MAENERPNSLDEGKKQQPGSAKTASSDIQHVPLKMLLHFAKDLSPRECQYLNDKNLPALPALGSASDTHSWLWLQQDELLDRSFDLKLLDK